MNGEEDGVSEDTEDLDNDMSNTTQSGGVYQVISDLLLRVRHLARYIMDSDRIVDILDTVGFLDDALRVISGDVLGCSVDT